jgi:hypothetical protein
VLDSLTHELNMPVRKRIKILEEKVFPDGTPEDARITALTKK